MLHLNVVCMHTYKDVLLFMPTLKQPRAHLTFFPVELGIGGPVESTAHKDLF